jgi:hypothetical protein
VQAARRTTREKKGRWEARCYSLVRGRGRCGDSGRRCGRVVHGDRALGAGAEDDSGEEEGRRQPGGAGVRRRYSSSGRRFRSGSKVRSIGPAVNDRAGDLRFREAVLAEELANGVGPVRVVPDADFAGGGGGGGGAAGDQVGDGGGAGFEVGRDGGQRADVGKEHGAGAGWMRIVAAPPPARLELGRGGTAVAGRRKPTCSLIGLADGATNKSVSCGGKVVRPPGAGEQRREARHEKEAGFDGPCYSREASLLNLF